MACGPGRFGDWLVPDCIGGMNMVDACRWHDAAYTDPRGRSKKLVDRIFYRQLLAIAGPSRWKRTIAWVYFWAVSRGRWSWYKCRRKDKKSKCRNV